MKYLHNNNYASPGSYCNGLDNIEKLFCVDIDAEFGKDRCKSLYDIIQETRKNPEKIGKNEHDVRTYASKLNKYIQFRQGQNLNNHIFTWIPFYEEFATKLIAYKNNREELLEIIKGCFEDLPFEYPFREQGREDYDDIDPFTIFGTFNKGMRDENRIAIIRKYKEVFSVVADVPQDFKGIPVLMNMSAWFFAYKANREESDIDNLWHLFETALAYADGDNSVEKEFIEIYNQVITQRQVKWNITIGLYWVRPKSFLSLDSVSRTYLPIFNPPVGGSISTRELPDGRKYLRDINELKRSFNHEHTMAKSFYELSRRAFELAESEDYALENSDNTIEPYTKSDFLNDVYMTEEKYDTCYSRLKHKKNIILQGAPGVGKTFAARRLAWSIMGVKDNNRIEFVQFHQSYAYEDFIMGYKPVDNGFSLEKGVFYDFCLKAKEDPYNDYFFIIDEINRGNMSKIFGELLMLIENDYRGTEITLAYDRKPLHNRYDEYR